MPGFGAVVPVVNTEDLKVSLYGYSRVERGFSFPDNGGTVAQATEAVTRLSALSNMGTISWEFRGVRRWVEDSQVFVRDEAYGESETATLVWQDAGNVANPEVTIRIPAPGAEIFVSGVLVNPDQALVAPAITAMNVFLNAGGAGYAFKGGYKNTAKKGEKRGVPNLVDPTAGDAAGPSTPTP